MKNKDYKMSKLKHELFQNTRRGKEFVLRKLTSEEAEFVSRIAHIEEYLYEITIHFEPFFSPKGKTAILKDLYFNYWKKHQNKAIKRLRRSEIEKCKEMGMTVKPYKYKIWVNKL